MMLPGTDGIELMKDILETAEVPVIFLSAYGQDQLVARALDMGAVDYVAKPFSPTELAARIRAALRRRAASEPSEPYVLGGLVVNYGERQATLACRPITKLRTTHSSSRIYLWTFRSDVFSLRGRSYCVRFVG